MSNSTKFVFNRGMENSNFVVGMVLMDLSKVFQCLPHNLLIPKLAAYGLEEKTLLYLYSYLENRKQRIKTNNINSSFQTIKFGVSQGFIMGPI